jgi:hypothetical protein
MCFNFPVYYENQYTELANLRENAIRSLALVIVMMVLSRGLYAFAIAIIEVGLISTNVYIAVNWEIRDALFVAAHYTTLQLAAYIAELAIIGVTGILGAAMFGTDDNSNNSRALPRWFSRPYRTLRR